MKYRKNAFHTMEIALGIETENCFGDDNGIIDKLVLALDELEVTLLF